MTRHDLDGRSKIGKLAALKKLTIGRAKKLKALPPEIGQLRKLEHANETPATGRPCEADVAAIGRDLQQHVDIERLRTLVPRARIVS